MTLLIIAFGVLIALAGAVMLINPDTVFGVLRKHGDKPALHIFAVVIRLILGALLIMQASASKLPLFMEVLGWIAVVAALVLAVIGRKNFNRLMSWALSIPASMQRVGGVFAVVFGAIVVYAFV